MEKKNETADRPRRTGPFARKSRSALAYGKSSLCCTGLS